MATPTPSYGLVKALPNATYHETIERVTAALAAQGFGVLTEIDVATTLKAKLGLDLPPYIILGACNPHIASKAIAAENQIGLLLPCNVVVQAVPGGGVLVSAADPIAMGAVTANPALEPLMQEARTKIQAALDAL